MPRPAAREAPGVTPAAPTSIDISWRSAASLRPRSEANLGRVQKDFRLYTVAGGKGNQ